MAKKFYRFFMDSDNNIIKLSPWYQNYGDTLKLRELIAEHTGCYVNISNYFSTNKLIYHTDLSSLIHESYGSSVKAELLEKEIKNKLINEIVDKFKFETAEMWGVYVTNPQNNISNWVDIDPAADKKSIANELINKSDVYTFLKFIQNNPNIDISDVFTYKEDRSFCGFIDPEKAEKLTGKEFEDLSKSEKEQMLNKALKISIAMGNSCRYIAEGFNKKGKKIMDDFILTGNSYVDCNPRDIAIDLDNQLGKRVYYLGEYHSLSACLKNEKVKDFIKYRDTITLLKNTDDLSKNISDIEIEFNSDDDISCLITTKNDYSLEAIYTSYGVIFPRELYSELKSDEIDAIEDYVKEEVQNSGIFEEYGLDEEYDELSLEEKLVAASEKAASVNDSKESKAHDDLEL